MHVQQFDIAILAPDINDQDKITVRYAGLFDELSKQAVDACLSTGQKSFDSESQLFLNVTDVEYRPLADYASVEVVRDLTMPKDPDSVALYKARNGPTIINHPATNAFLSDKSKVAIAIAEQGGADMIQANIDASAGIPELGVKGAHYIRAISVGGKVLGSIARSGNSYGAYIGNDNLPDGMHKIVAAAHTVLANQPGEGKNVVAIDMVRGINASGDQVDVLKAVQRKPFRISKYDLRSDEHLDKPGLLHLANLWDVAEAAMLAQQVR